jgi:hypothetical protein
MVSPAFRRHLMSLDPAEAKEAAAILEARLDEERLPQNHGAVVSPLIRQAREHLAKDPSSTLTSEQVWGRAQALIDQATAQQLAA